MTDGQSPIRIQTEVAPPSSEPPRVGARPAIVTHNLRRPARVDQMACLWLGGLVEMTPPA